MHFDKGQTPPVNAFWSLTMYNAKQAFVANPINRYAIGDRDKLKFNPDGSLDIYVQHDSPGKDKESNWLPADAGSFNVVMRMYWPKETAFNGTLESAADQEGELGQELKKYTDLTGYRPVSDQSSALIGNSISTDKWDEQVLRRRSRLFP